MAGLSTFIKGWLVASSQTTEGLRGMMSQVFHWAINTGSSTGYGSIRGKL